MLEFGQRFLEDDYGSVLQLLLSTAAIAVPLFVALVVQRFFLLRGNQIERAAALGRLQDQLKEYRRAIYGLASDLHSQALERGIDIDLKRPLQSVRSDPEFWRRETAGLEQCVIALWEFGSGHYSQPEFATTNMLLSEGEFQRLFEAIQACSGVFSRRKYYRHVLEPLGLSDTSDWSNHLATERTRWDVPEAVGHGKDILSMAFWVDTIDTAYALMERMIPLYWTLVARPPARMLAYSVFLAGVGILVPLALLAVDAPPVAEFYATYAALLLFGGALVASLADLWTYLRTSALRS